MNVISTRLPGVVVIVPRVFGDPRGYFVETWNQARFTGAGLPAAFVQDNLSFSNHKVLRGLHLQAPNAQAKLVSVLTGAVYDIAVDVRAGSPTFGEWVGVTLSSDEYRQLFIPAGFAHGFVVTSESATVTYKCDAFYSPGNELTIRWDDPDLGIEWPLSDPILSAKDREGLRLRDVPRDRLPPYES